MDPCPRFIPLKGKPHVRCLFAFNLIIFTLIFLWAFDMTHNSFAIYPEIKVSGYKYWLYNKIDVDPVANYFLYVSSTEGFNRTTGGPWNEVLRLNVNLQHNEDLGINYLINQYPAQEDNYRLGLNYKNYSLILGNPNLFINQELMPADLINGTTIAGEFGKLNLKYLISGDFPKAALKGPFKDQRQYLSPKYFGPKSQTGYGQNDSYLELLGYELGRSDIKGESVQVSVGRKKLIKDFDFFLDTEYGLLLLPSAYKSYQTGIITYESIAGEKTEKSFNLETETSRRAYYIPEFRVIDGSENIAVDGLKLTRGIDYRAYYNKGLFILNRPINEDADVKIDYEFTYGPGVAGSQKAQGLALEYQPMDWQKIGISFYRVNSSSSEVGSLATSSKSDDIFSIADKLVLNSNTYILGEYAFSTDDSYYFTGISSGTTLENGSAVGISGRTRIGNLWLSANYKKHDPAFASLRKIKKNENWMYEEKNLQGQYKINDNSEVRGGIGSELFKIGAATQEETATIVLGVSFKLGSAVSFDMDVYLKNPKSSEDELSQLIAVRYEPLGKNRSTNSLFKDISLTAKGYSNSIGSIWKENNYQFLSYLESHFGLSGNIGWKYAIASEAGFPSGSRSDGLLRIAYLFDFKQGHKFEIYSDYLEGLQNHSIIRGENEDINANISEIGYGFLWKIPQENPILTDLFFGGYIKTTNYSDRLNSANNYRAITMSTEGRLDF